MITRVILTAVCVVMVVAALKFMVVSRLIVAPIFVGVKVSVGLRFPEFEVLCGV